MYVTYYIHIVAYKVNKANMNSWSEQINDSILIMQSKSSQH